MWIDGSQLVFLGISIVAFSAGLVFYAYSSKQVFFIKLNSDCLLYLYSPFSQAFYTPPVTAAATGVTFIGLIAILIWMVYEIWVSPVLAQQAGVIKSSAESVHSDVSKFSFLQSGVTGTLSNALSSLGFQPHRETPQEDVESVEGKNSVSEEPPKKGSFGDNLRAKLQDNVKNVSMLNTTVTAFLSVGQQHKRPHQKTLSSPRSRLQIDTQVPSVPVTQLNISSQPARTAEFARYGTIHDIAYSDDGKWLAVAWLVVLIAGIRKIADCT